MLIKTIQRVNSQIDHYLAPESPNPMEVYRQVLFQLDFDRGLHFGSGRDRHKVGTELETDGEIIALDPDIDGLKQNAVEKKVLGDGQRLPFNSDEFDLVFSEYVFEHLPNPSSALEEIGRVLQSGGDLVILVPNPNHYFARVGDVTPFWFQKLWQKLGGVKDEAIEQDVFPVQYEWGTYGDITKVNFNWEIEEFHSFPGPTWYTKILPFHILFVLFDRVMATHPKHHVNYLIHYTV